MMTFYSYRTSAVDLTALGSAVIDRQAGMSPLLYDNLTVQILP